MKTFTVWTEQINAQMFEVRATNEERAMDAARKIWRQDNAGYLPRIEAIEEQKPGRPEEL